VRGLVAKHASSHQRAARIALVDDDAAVRVALTRLLRIAGYEVESFASGDELLAACEARTPDCLLLDVHLPGLSGFELLQRVRDNGANPPAVFLTASEDASIADRVRQCGGVRLLRKPFSSDVLREAIGAALATRPIRS